MATEAEILDAVERRGQALTTRDPAALRALLHPLFCWTSHRGQRFDRDSYVDANVAGSLHWLRQDLEPEKILLDGDAAVVTGVVVDEVEREGQAEVHRLLITMTWVYREGSWICLAGHAGPDAP